MFGIYSTIYIALPVTEWLDKVLFSRMNGGSGASGTKGSRGKSARRAPAPA
jgi:hypothetical protein